MRINRIFSIGLLFIGSAVGQHTITLNLQGMTPHVGQLLKARMVESPSGKQVAETTVMAVQGATLRLVFAGESGKSYVLDYFADMNGDGKYSSPPADHAWRKSAGPLHHEGIVIDAAHDLYFTDIQYPSSSAIAVLRPDPEFRRRHGRMVNLLGRHFTSSLGVYLSR
jgi:hypothetical protein